MDLNIQGEKSVLKFLTCGSVDDGKSTLIGHLLYLTGNIPVDQLKTLEMESSRIGTAGGGLDFSLLMDGLMAEREQGITIDVAYRYFAAAGRKFIVADTPGHEQYTRNMATGASQCDAALILVDVQQGILPQTRRHALICALMGIERILFVINKMDRVDWDEVCFRRVESQKALLLADLESFGIRLQDAAAIPVSALTGDNIALLSSKTPWFSGDTLLEWLAKVSPGSWRTAAPLRIPVQHVIKGQRGGEGWQHLVPDSLKSASGGTFRAYAGTVVSGGVACGDELVALPSGVSIKVASILAGDREVNAAAAGSAVALTLAGEHDIVRGDILAPARDRPEVADQLKVRIIWMDETPLFAGRHYDLYSAGGTARAEITRLRNRIEPESYRRLAAHTLEKNDIAEAEISLSRPIPFDPYGENRETGAFILVDRLTNATLCCGMILHSLRKGENVHWQAETVDRSKRSALKGHQPQVIWFTGLSGSGKSTIANALESRLSSMGRHTMILDGDNIRHGLSRDLGFTEADRIENIRRIGEVAKLMTDAGLIVITAFISPFRAERSLVRAMIPESEFIEVFVDTPLQVCEERDVKGLYKKARNGEIPNFTGVNSPYEAPQSPELVVDASKLSVEDSVEKILKFMDAG
ncbi:MAG: adenylyl-sulfate kinase [Geobacteraceae bacterium]|nr:adenylyl-sulfate kinase [Geobacteraceae bacterium]